MCIRDRASASSSRTRVSNLTYGAASRSGGYGRPRPSAGLNPLIESVRGEVGAAGPGDGALRDVDLAEAVRGSRALEDGSAHAVEHVDLAARAVGEGEAEDAVVGDLHGGDVVVGNVHRNGSIGCLLYTSDAADDLTRVDLGGLRIIQKK